MIYFRHFADTDTERIKELHKAQGLDYVLPDIAGKDMLVRAVIEEDGIITNAVFLRKTAEAYWLFDPAQASRKEKLGRLFMIQKEINDAARAAGFTDVHAWIPPDINTKSFESTMFKLGWIKPLWPCYNCEVK